MSKNPGRIKVNFFQRKPRKGFSFSIEAVFEDIRQRLADRIDARIYISGWFNDGYYSKLLNMLQAASRQGKNVNHITGEVHFLNLLMRRKNVILTIHDCGMMERKTGTAKKIVQWLYLSAPAKKAKFITTISEATKSQIIQYTGTNPEKIHVIPIAVNPIFQQYPKAFNKQKPVILQVGTAYNKNLSRLIVAIKDLPCHLSIIGKLDEEQLRLLSEYKIEYSNAYNLPLEQLVEKYRECDMLAFISLHEGFGMPIVEANAMERPVITSNLSSMPEVADNAACLVDPYSIDDIRRGILKIIDDDSYRKTLIANGKTNKLRFDGGTIAGMYLDLYRKF